MQVGIYISKHNKKKEAKPIGYINIRYVKFSILLIYDVNCSKDACLVIDAK